MTDNADFYKKLSLLIALKDYALSRNLFLEDEILEEIGKISGDTYKNEQTRNAKLDICIREVTRVTYPTTIKTLNIDGSRRFGKGSLFLTALFFLGAGVLWAAMHFHAISLGNVNAEIEFYQSVFAACLGVLGAIIYIFFNLIGVLSEEAFDEKEHFSNFVRIVIGAIVGWLTFFAIDMPNEINQQNEYLLLLPFLVGFSTRLVVGIINQAITAISLTLGLEDAAVNLRERDMRNQAGKLNQPQRQKLSKQ